MEDLSKKLAQVEREHIDNVRRRLERLKCKSPANNEIVLTISVKFPRVACVCIKSEAKNALSGKMIGELTQVIDRLETWAIDGDGDQPARAVLLFGANDTFCSGSDLLGARESAGQPGGLELAQVMQYNLMRLQRLPVVSAALIKGYALGGGAELALGCDLRIMTKSARVGFVQARMGVCCGWGGGSRLVRLVGAARATDLLMSARVVGAEEAERLGLADRIVEDFAGGETECAEVMEFLLKRAIASADTVRAIKTMVNAARLLPLVEALKVEAQLFASTWGKDAHLRALDGNFKHRGDSQDSADDLSPAAN